MTSDTTNKPPAPEQEAPRITFPCQYPVKVMGEAVDGFERQVLEIFQRHAPDTREAHVVARPSAKGNYIALTITIQATGLEQLELLFADLKTLPALKLVL